MLRNAAAIARIVRKRRCDVIHAHGRAPAWSAYVAARLTRVPFVTSWYKGFRDQNVLKRLYNSVMARGDRVIAVSDQIAELINERYRIPWNRIEVVPASIDVGIFRSGGDLGAIASRRCGGSSASAATHKVVLVVGRMLRRKGHHVVVQAAQRLKEMGLKDFVCVFVGEDQGHSRYTGELWDQVLATDTADVVRADRPGRRHAGGLCGGDRRGVGRDPAGRPAARDPRGAGDGASGGGVRSRRRPGCGAGAAGRAGRPHDRPALFDRRRRGAWPRR